MPGSTCLFSKVKNGHHLSVNALGNMRGLLTGILLSSTALALCAADPEFFPDVTTWQEVTPPPEPDVRASFAWFLAANHSRINWRILAKSGRVLTELVADPFTKTGPKPDFTLKVERFAGSAHSTQVDDG